MIKLKFVSLLIFFTGIFVVSIYSYSEASSCDNNATIPLSSVLDIQRYLNCNGFDPGPIDGQSGPKTVQAIKTFQAANGLTADGVVGPATRSAMRAYSPVRFTFTGAGWGHGVGLSQYGAKGLAELGASFCTDTNSCTGEEIVDYYFQDVSIENLSELSLSLSLIHI